MDERALIVRSIDAEGARAARVSFATTTPLRAAAGQYVTLAVIVGETLERRAYSVLRQDDRGFKIIVKRVPGGRVSSALCDGTRVGDRLSCSAPNGDFVLRSPGVGHVALVGGGSGVSPLVALLEAHLRAANDARATLVVCDRSMAEAICVEDLSALARAYGDRCHVVRAIDAGELPRDAVRGPLDEGSIAALLRAARERAGPFAGAYVCGPDGLMTLARDAFARQDVSVDRIYSERFCASDAPGDCVDAELSIAGRAAAITVPARTTLLRAMLDAGAMVEHSCGVGQCGACRMQRVEGRVTMTEREGLTHEDEARGIVLPCVAYAASPTVRLEPC
jgi:ferredoxin-NADP reductase